MRYKDKSRVIMVEGVEKNIPYIDKTNWKHRSIGIKCCYCDNETKVLNSRIAGVTEFIYECANCGAELLAKFDMQKGEYYTVFCSTDWEHPEDRYARQHKEDIGG